MPETPRPRVHIITVSYDSSRYLPGYLAALEAMDYPAESLRVTVVDNNSHDDTLRILKAHEGRVRPVLYAHWVNSGFAEGNNIALRTTHEPYVLFLNADTSIAPDCLRTLVERMERDPRAGLAEARQSPHEHPKEYDPATGETPWCSAACLLARTDALRATGFFDRRFYLYCEDVDLSWRMWAAGWKCVYVPAAVCGHHTLELARHKSGRHDEYFFGLRNGLFMRFIYGGPWVWSRYAWRVARIALSRSRPRPERFYAAKALGVQPKYLRHLLLRRRHVGAAARRVPWIRFYGWDYHRLRAPGPAGAGDAK